MPKIWKLHAESGLKIQSSDQKSLQHQESESIIRVKSGKTNPGGLWLKNKKSAQEFFFKFQRFEINPVFVNPHISARNLIDQHHLTMHITSKFEFDVIQIKTF